MIPEEIRARYLDGLATEANVGRDALDQPGTTVVGRDDRAGSSAMVCYRTGDHLLVWADPAVVDQAIAAGLEPGPAAITQDDLAGRAAAAGFEYRVTAVMQLLSGHPTASEEPPASIPGYHHRRLGCEPSTVDAVRAFAEQCDPVDVEEAALDELDEFDEAAINVLTPVTGDGPETNRDIPEILAYASAARWDWDETLADIGVLVHPDHRRRGLARFVVADTVRQLLSDGRIPLYRHDAANLGSAAVAAGAGFEPVASLDMYVLAGAESESESGD
jgi:GNAT superfamily N-acetyltransferase